MITLYNYRNIFSFEELILYEQGKKRHEVLEKKAVQYPKKLYLTFFKGSNSSVRSKANIIFHDAEPTVC